MRGASDADDNPCVHKDFPMFVVIFVRTVYIQVPHDISSELKAVETVDVPELLPLTPVSAPVSSGTALPQ